MNPKWAPGIFNVTFRKENPEIRISSCADLCRGKETSTRRRPLSRNEWKWKAGERKRGRTKEKRAALKVKEKVEATVHRTLKYFPIGVKEKLQKRVISRHQYGAIRGIKANVNVFLAGNFLCISSSKIQAVHFEDLHQPASLQTGLTHTKHYVISVCSSSCCDPSDICSLLPEGSVSPRYGGSTTHHCSKEDVTTKPTTHGLEERDRSWESMQVLLEQSTRNSSMYSCRGFANFPNYLKHNTTVRPSQIRHWRFTNCILWIAN